MKMLKVVNLGNNLELAELPDVVGHPVLRTMAFAMSHHVTQVNFSNLPELQEMGLVGMSSLEALPDLEQFPKLTTFISQYPSMFCCNGFLSDTTCDLAGGLGGFCAVLSAFSGETSCYAGEPSTATTLAVVRGYFMSCLAFVSTADMIVQVPLQADADQCDGVKYKQSTFTAMGTPGICYNYRLQPISCYPLEEGVGYDVMRRAQIAQGIGEKCDPAVEAWLGCTA